MAQHVVSLVSRRASFTVNEVRVLVSDLGEADLEGLGRTAIAVTADAVAADHRGLQRELDVGFVLARRTAAGLDDAQGRLVQGLAGNRLDKQVGRGDVGALGQGELGDIPDAWLAVIANGDGAKTTEPPGVDDDPV